MHSTRAHSAWSAHLDLPLAGGASAVRAQLPNGIRLTVVPNPVADVIAVRCFLRGGSSVERGDRAGVASLVAAVLTKGTERYSSRDIAREVESLGAGLGAESTSDYFEVSFKSIGADFPRLLTLVADILRHATFPEREVERERHLALQALKARRERPFTLAYERLRCELYSTQHPYARSPLGTPESLASISRSDLVDYHRSVLQPDRLTIALAGNINPDDAFAAIAAVFGDWSVLPAKLPVVSDECPERDRVTYCETLQDTQQAIVMVGYLAASIHSPDYVPLKLLNTYLGNGSSSRLFEQLRDKLGLAYEVTSLYATRQQAA
ncbi:MAG: pitrilysin family protein, partial [Cyanobacteria bacterium J06639_1]